MKDIEWNYFLLGSHAAFAVMAATLAILSAVAHHGSFYWIVFLIFNMGMILVNLALIHEKKNPASQPQTP